jgi:translation initiation factor 1A
LANYRSTIRKRKAGSNPVSSEDATEVTRVRTPRKDKNEVLATVASLLGSKRVTLQCMDGVVRMGRIPGSKHKKMWVREGDIVIANPWEIKIYILKLTKFCVYYNLFSLYHRPFL